MRGKYTSFTIETRTFTTWLVWCDLEERLVTVTRDVGQWSRKHWLERLAWSPNLDERKVYMRAKELVVPSPEVEIRTIPEAQASTFLRLLNDPLLPQYPGWDSASFLGYRDGWSYDFTAYGANVPTISHKFLSALFPSDEKPVCEKIISLAEELWPPRW